MIGLGIAGLDSGDIQRISSNPIDQHCQQLIIQMNALIKNMSVEMFKFNQEDFEHLRQAALEKYNELVVK